MSTEWLDAVGSIISFVKISKRPASEKEHYEAILCRLFCLLHAVAMEDLCSLEDEHFRLLDIEAINVEDLYFLRTQKKEHSACGKVHVVIQWVKLHIIQGIDAGLLAAPPPILGRVYQEVGAGMMHYHRAQEISMWPFPFPYAQLSVFLVFLHACLTPLIMMQWTMSSPAAGILTFASVLCFAALNYISVELESPFGEDSNDLPVYALHNDFVDGILAMLNPNLWVLPRLKERSRYPFLGFGELNQKMSKEKLTLRRYLQTDHRPADEKKAQLEALTGGSYGVEAKDTGFQISIADPGDCGKSPNRSPQQKSTGMAQVPPPPPLALPSFQSDEIAEAVSKAMITALEQQTRLYEEFLAKQAMMLEKNVDLTEKARDGLGTMEVQLAKVVSNVANAGGAPEVHFACCSPTPAPRRHYVVGSPRRPYSAGPSPRLYDPSPRPGNVPGSSA